MLAVTIGVSYWEGGHCAVLAMVLEKMIGRVMRRWDVL